MHVPIFGMESLHRDSIVRGHHVYKDIWTLFLGETLHVKQEYINAEDCFAVCIVIGDSSTWGDIITRHVP